MILNTLNVVFESADLQRLLKHVVGRIDKVKELDVALEHGVVVLSGKILVGLTIPFSTKWEARPLVDGFRLCLTLCGVSVGMVGMGEKMVSGQVLALLKSKLENYEAVKVVDKDIVVDLRKVLAAQGVTLNALLRSVTITPEGIELVGGAVEESLRSVGFGM